LRFAIKNKIKITLFHSNFSAFVNPTWRRGRRRRIVGVTATYTINAYHHVGCELESRSWRGALDTTLGDIVYQ